ncbi:MAG: aminopeptidase [Cyclobacteriaceae bacterium]|jgi:predicted aminopeptidase|nr:aminopeptidase [Cyclobacteriaceae bacterium]
MTLKRKIGLLVLAALGLLVAFHGELITYGVRQGMGQWKIVSNAVPMDELLQDPAYPDSLKQKLLLVKAVRQYAIDSLGLRDTDNYQNVFDQQGQELLWVVTACEPFKLQPKLWKFPVVGAVPYKGFFEKERALNERKRLEAEGFDVSIRNPGGWSTLGWFNDPILSGMLQRREGDLANLIIHEMVHATIWVKDDAEFNENLATFIGDTAAYYFLRSRYGLASEPYQRYVNENADYRKFSAHMLRGSAGLDSLYQSLTDGMPFDEKKLAKERYIRQIIDAIDTLTLHYPPKSKARFQKQLPNNTYFMTFRTYQSKQDTLGRDFAVRFRGDLKAYVADWKARFGVE